MRTMSKERNDQICELYASEHYTTEAIAKAFGISRRRVQQLAKAAGIIRTRAEGNRVATPLKSKHRIRRSTKPVKRRPPTSAVRYLLLLNHPWCAACGARPQDGALLELDHIDDDPSNNDPSNFQVLCGPCNKGKYNASVSLPLR